MEPIKLTKYSENGEKIIDYDYSKMINTIEEELGRVRQQYNHFDIGFIILGNKKFTKEENLAIFYYFARSKWNKLIAFDFQQTF